mmetsp:Transcript_20261/g.28498  ORF Transcript_20261/g.28498 Transcript_20261/m.28498 type:complete len:255 (-) Transcript_20261:73-837(-)
MRKFLSSSSGESDGLGSLMNEVLKSFSNPAFIPPIEQHYTFERINDRYQKDTMAFQKTINLNKATTTNTPSIIPNNKSISRTSFVRKLAKSTISQQLSNNSEKGLSQPKHNQCNGTIILLDMNKLDTTLTNMDTLRDQISFLLHQHRSNTNSMLPSGSSTTALVGAESRTNVTISTNTMTPTNVETQSTASSTNYTHNMRSPKESKTGLLDESCRLETENQRCTFTKSSLTVLSYMHIEQSLQALTLTLMQLLD